MTTPARYPTASEIYARLNASWADEIGPNYDEIIKAAIDIERERVSCWRLITPVAPHAWIDGLPPTRNDAEMEAEKRLGWSVELAYSRPPATPEDRRDGERLDWLMRQVRGDEFRRIGIHTSAGCTRAAIDAARGNHECV